MLFEIRKEYHSLRASEKRVADVILEEKIPLEDLTITRLAGEAHVSQPSVLRFAQALGLKGFKELKVSLLRADGEGDTAPNNSHMYGHSISPDDCVEEIPAKIIYSSVKLLEDTLKSIDISSFTQAVEKLKQAENIVLYGVENSGSAIADLETKLLYLGLNCKSYKDSYLQSVSARHLTGKDVAVGISYSGSSRDTVDTMKRAKEAGASTIVITNFPEAILCRYGDIVICTGNQQQLCGEAIFSRTTQMAVNDMLYTGILASDFKTYAGKIEESTKVIEDRSYHLL